MGVVHKLKPEVIQFILNQKKENPKMGCRKLADLATDKFQKKISKSSVNTILKEAELSNTVGRPAEDAPKEKKFEIPKQKKDQIRESLEKLVSETPPDEVESKVEERPQKKEKPEIKKPPQERPSLMPDSTKEPVLKESDTSSFYAMVGDMQKKRDALFQESLPGVGIFLVMAYYWSHAQRAPLNGIFQRQLQERSAEQQELILDILIAFCLFGKADVSLDEDALGMAFWKAASLTPTQFKERFSVMAMAWKITPTFIADYLTEKEQMFQDVGGFELQLADDSKVFLDAQQCSLWDQSHAGLPQSLDRSLNEVAQNIISQSRYFTGQTLSHQEQMTEAQRRALLNCLDPKKHSLKYITVLDVEFKELAQFDQVVSAERPFIFGIHAHQKEFNDAMANIQWAAKAPYYHFASGEVLELTDTLTNIEGYEVRIVGLWDKESQPRGALLSNDRAATAENLVLSFLQRSPHFLELKNYESLFKGLEENRHPDQETIDLLLREEAATKITTQTSLWEIMGDFKETLSRHFWRMHASKEVPFSDVTRFISDICNIKGGILREDQTLYVYLNVSKEHPHFDWIQRTIFTLNQQHIQTRQGHLLVVLSP